MRRTIRRKESLVTMDRPTEEKNSEFLIDFIWFWPVEAAHLIKKYLLWPHRHIVNEPLHAVKESDAQWPQVATLVEMEAWTEMPYKTHIFTPLSRETLIAQMRRALQRIQNPFKSSMLHIIFVRYLLLLISFRTN